MFIMNTVWLKIVAVVVLLIVIFVIISKIANKASKPEEPVRTVGDTFREDDKRLRAEPNIVESNVPEGQQATAVQPPKFKEMTEDEKAGADQLFELALAQRKMGRLPGVSYGAMVQYCRQIIERYPGTEYAYKAKRMLADIPVNQRDRYNITDDEINPNK
jgi:hypothetical protein